MIYLEMYTQHTKLVITLCIITASKRLYIQIYYMHGETSSRFYLIRLNVKIVGSISRNKIIPTAIYG